MLFGDFLNKLAPFMGAKADDENIVKLQGIKELATANIPDTWAAGLEGLMTLDSAKNNEAIRGHHYAMFHNALDSEIERGMSDLGLDETAIAELKADKKSFSRYGKLLSKAKELSAKAAAAKGGDKKELEEEISKLHGQLKAAVEDQKSAIEKVNSSWQDRLKGIEMEKIYSSFDYGLDLPKEVLIATTSNLVSKVLQDKKLKVEYLPDANKIVLKTENGMDYFENNSPVNFKDLAASVVSENKLIKTAPTGQQPKPGSPGPIQGATDKNAAMFAALQSLESELQNNS